MSVHTHDAGEKNSKFPACTLPSCSPLSQLFVAMVSCPGHSVPVRAIDTSLISFPQKNTSCPVINGWQFVFVWQVNDAKRIVDHKVLAWKPFIQTSADRKKTGGQTRLSLANRNASLSNSTRLSYLSETSPASPFSRMRVIRASMRAHTNRKCLHPSSGWNLCPTHGFWHLWTRMFIIVWQWEQSVQWELG